MTIFFTIILTLYLCLGMCAGCCLLDYRYGDLDYETNNTQDKEKYYKLKTKAAWITALGMFMLIVPILIAILIVIL